MSWAHPVIGDLSEQLTLVRPTSVDDGMGGQVPGEPEVVATVWAQMDPRSGYEVLAAGGIVATMPTRFRLRYRDDVDETWLLDWRGRRLQITAPPVPEGLLRREWIVLSAIAGGPD